MTEVCHQLFNVCVCIPNAMDWKSLKLYRLLIGVLFFFFCQSEFICGLLKVVVEKLEHSIPKIIDDDNVFSHFIDELLLFDKELYMVHNYHSIEHGCLHVLTSDACLQRWVELERKCKYNCIWKCFVT